MVGGDDDQFAKKTKKKAWQLQTHTYIRDSKFGKKNLIKLKGEIGNPKVAARCFRSPDGMMDHRLHKTLCRRGQRH